MNTRVVAAGLALFMAAIGNGFAQQESVASTSLTAGEHAEANSAKIPSTEEIIFLPKHRVHDFKRSAFREIDLLDGGGMKTYTAKKFPGTGGPLAGAGDYGLLMHSDEVRLSQMVRWSDLVFALRENGDVNASKDLQEEIYRTFIRGHDSETERMDKSVNPHCRR